MKPVTWKLFPKEVDLCPAAFVRTDFDEVATRIAASPVMRRFSLRDPFPERYRDIYLTLSTGRSATLTQREAFPERVEIGLEILDDEAFFEADLLEVLAGIGVAVDADAVRKINNFTWIPSRQADSHQSDKGRSKGGRAGRSKTPKV